MTQPVPPGASPIQLFFARLEARLPRWVNALPRWANEMPSGVMYELLALLLAPEASWYARLCMTQPLSYLYEREWDAWQWNPADFGWRFVGALATEIFIARIRLGI